MMETKKIVTISVLVMLVTGGMLSTLGNARSTEGNEKLNEDLSEDSTNKNQLGNGIDEETLEKARIALKDKKVREVLKEEHGFNEETIEKTRENLEEEQDGPGSEEYEPKVDPGTLISILKAGATIYNTANEVLRKKSVEKYDYSSIEDSFIGASVNDVTLNGWFNDIYKVEKYLPAWKNQKVKAWYHSSSLTLADIYVDADYVWEGQTINVMDGEVPGGPGSSLKDYCDRTIPSNDPSKNEEGLRFWWTASGRITADLAQHTGNAPSGGGGCPYICSWNGERYSPENNILLQSNDKLGSRNEMDVIDRYILDELPKRNGKYSIQLKELGNDISHIKKTKMMAIDRPKDTNIAVTQNGEIITYDDLLTPNEIKADVEARDKGLLSSSSEKSIKIKSGDEITLDYSHTLEKLENKSEKQVLLIDINMKKSVPNINVNSGDKWTETKSFLPRSNGGIQAIDLTANREINEIQKVKIGFNGEHELDFLGLANITDDNYKIQELKPVHSGSQESSELRKKETYTKLTPRNEGITLNYKILKKKKGMERELMFVAEGFYNKHVPKERFSEGVQIKARPNGTVYTPILESYEGIEHFVWRFSDGTISTKFRPYREPKKESYYKGRLTVIYDDWRIKTFNIE